jgi:hypothetical protein
MSANEIIKEYEKKKNLSPQDIIKCYLRVYQQKNNISYYDCRVHLWLLKPGDLVFVNGTFVPIVSYVRIDDTLKKSKCGHILEMEENKKRGKITCQCRKWYFYYKSNNGKIKKFYPPWDGLTYIPYLEIQDLLKNLGHENSTRQLLMHFTDKIISQEKLNRLLSEIRKTRKNKMKDKINHFRKQKGTNVSFSKHQRKQLFELVKE